MRTLVVNPGSSSLKLSVVDNGTIVDQQTLQQWNGLPDPHPVTQMWDKNNGAEAIGLRIVHGGNRIQATLLDSDEIQALHHYETWAPVHQPRSLVLAESLAQWFPDVPLIGCYDTAFHVNLPEFATTYPIPREWTHKFGIRRFGFHGLSCAYAVRRTAELLHRESNELSLICCHIGSGVSVTAIDDGISVDTSMGFTPLDGVVMATRPGALDPGLVLYLLRELTIDTVEPALSRHCGLAGLSGTTGDIREVLAARTNGSAQASLAIAVYLHRLRREIAAARVSLRRLDAVVLTGGIAEHQPNLCTELLQNLGFLGLDFDPVVAGLIGDRVISSERAKSPVVLIQSREDLEIAREVEKLFQ